ncbi:unnamed protein product [Closterium sp. NIES-54]
MGANQWSLVRNGAKAVLNTKTVSELSEALPRRVKLTTGLTLTRARLNHVRAGRRSDTTRHPTGWTSANRSLLLLSLLWLLLLRLLSLLCRVPSNQPNTPPCRARKPSTTYSAASTRRTSITATTCTTNAATTSPTTWTTSAATTSTTTTTNTATTLSPPPTSLAMFPH